jgi:hypothetical protein
VDRAHKAHAIDDRGRIAGQGLLHGSRHGFLSTPARR